MRGTSRLVLVCAAVAAMACSVALIGPGTPPSAQAQPDEGWLPDPSWGSWYRWSDPGGSSVPEGLGPVEFRPNRVGVDSAGRIVVAGVRYDNTRGTACDNFSSPGNQFKRGDENIVVSRFLSDGALDASFGEAGTVIVPQMGHEAYIEDLVVSGDNIYVSTMNDILGCGMGQNAPPSVVVKVTAAGEVDSSFAEGGVWRAPGSFSRLHLSELGRGNAVAFAEGVAAYLSGADEVAVTDFSSALCLPFDFDNVGSIGGCPSARLDGTASNVAAVLTYGSSGGYGSGCDCIGTNQTLRILFGRLVGSTLEPNLQAGPSGVKSVDLSSLLGERRLVSEAWLSWDASGRLLVVAPASEPYPRLTYTGGGELTAMVMPHGRGLVTARFVADGEGGYALDQEYANGGVAYAPLPFTGPDDFWVNAMTLDAEDRPVMVALWYNPYAEFSAQFAVRLNRFGELDREYGEGGMVWLPGETPFIYGKAALDNKDNQYFATAWYAFATRKKAVPPFQLGRLTRSGILQVHDGSRWVRARQQARLSARIDLRKPLPNSVKAGGRITVIARVLANDSGKAFGRADLPVKGAIVNLNLLGAPGKPTFYSVAKGRTNARGVARITARITQSGLYNVAASAGDRVTSSGSAPKLIRVRSR